MTQEELNYIKDAFSQIIDDIAGNPDWYEAARAVTSDLGTLERELGKKIAFPPSDFDEAAEEANKGGLVGFEGVCWLTKETPKHYFKAGAEWMAGQGVSKDAAIGMATEEIAINVSQKTLDALELGAGDKVIVQIRKK